MNNHISTSMLADIDTQIQSDGIQKIVVGAVIEMAEHAPLLLRRVSDDFMGGLVELPSGTVDAGEPILNALAREIQEETGLIVKSIDSFVGWFDYVSGSGKKTRQLNFIVTTTTTNVMLSAEHDAFYTPDIHSDTFQKLNISDDTRRVIQTAFGLDATQSA